MYDNRMFCNRGHRERSNRVIKEELSMYTTYRRRVEKLQSDIMKLESRDIESVAGKVKGSMKDFPYTERRFSVQMEVPEAAEKKNKLIAAKKGEVEELRERMCDIETFISGIDDVRMKNIFEYRFLNDMTCEDVGEKIGYTKGRVSQMISNYLLKV